MAFNGSGVFSKLYSWVVEQASPPIEISKLDAQETDFATGLSNCILRDGTGVPTAATPWNSQNLTGVGTLTAVTGTISGNATVGGTLGVTGVITGVGSGLTTLNASNLSSGTVPSARVAGAYTAVTAIGNTGSHVSFGSSGNVTIAAPSSGAALSVAGNGSPNVNLTTAAGVSPILAFAQTGQTTWSIYNPISSNDLRIYNGSSDRVTLTTAGNVTISAPSSGHALTVNGVSGGSTLFLSVAAANIQNTLSFSQAGGGSWAIYQPASSTNLRFFDSGADRMILTNGGGMQLGSPTGGDKGAGTLNTAGNIYVNNVQVPRSAFANVAGSGGAVSQAQGIAFTSHTNGTGIYVLALTGFSGTPVAVAGPRNGSGIASVTSISSSSVTVSTFSDAGVPTDIDFALIVQGVL